MELDLDQPLPDGPADTDDEGVADVKNDVVNEPPPPAETDPEAETSAGVEP
jgi:hypothetical protein